MQTVHIPVLLEEVLEYLQPQSGGIYIDGTLGGGGHAEALLELGARVIGIDRDAQAIERTKLRLKKYSDRFICVKNTYGSIKTIAQDEGVYGTVAGILLDLGLSSDQLRDSSRGFSFMGSAPLDMRFGDDAVTARDILNASSEQELAHIFRDFGDERYAARIARLIAQRRIQAPITSTDQLVSLIEEAYRGKPRPRNIHVATKVFQALRIAVNDEYGTIRRALPDAVDVLKPGGRLAVISFHSGEDRIVKEVFRNLAKGCICPPKLPTCVCNNKPLVKLVTRKAVVPGEAELTQNPRSRSAQLRVIEKL